MGQRIDRANRWLLQGRAGRVNWDTVFLLITIPVAVLTAWPIIGIMVPFMGLLSVALWLLKD